MPFEYLLKSDIEIKSGSSLLNSIQRILLRGNFAYEAFRLYNYLNIISKARTGSTEDVKLNHMELMRFSEIFRENRHQEGFDLISNRLPSDKNIYGRKFHSQSISKHLNSDEYNPKDVPNFASGLSRTLDEFNVVQNTEISKSKDSETVMQEIDRQKNERLSRNHKNARLEKLNEILSEMNKILESSDDKRVLRLFNSELEKDKRFEEMIAMYDILIDSEKSANGDTYLIFLRGIVNELHLPNPSNLCDR